MTFVTTQPDLLAAAASQLQEIGAAMNWRNAAAATPTLAVVPAAADEVSALTATKFSAHAAAYQNVSAQAIAIHEMFVRILDASAGSYATTEAANATAASCSHVCRSRLVVDAYRSIGVGCSGGRLANASSRFRLGR
jgi:hypothetical protein